MKKRIVPALLAAALLGLLPVSAAFADTAGLPEEADIAYLQESGLVQGMDGENGGTGKAVGGIGAGTRGDQGCSPAERGGGGGGFPRFSGIICRKRP